MASSQYFDLSLINPRLRKYYVDKDLNVYSIKTGSLKALKRTSWKGFNGWFFSYEGMRISYSTERFNNYVSNNVYFNDWKKGNEMNKNVNVLKGFIIGSVAENGDVSFAIRPVVHQTENSARVECERLALANKGKTFMYVEVKGTVRASGVTWS